jgi:hypothetical protein
MGVRHPGRGSAPCLWMGTEVFGIVLLMNGHVLWRAYADTDLLSLDAQQRNSNVVTDNDGLADAACEDEHCIFLPWNWAFSNFQC